MNAKLVLYGLGVMGVTVAGCTDEPEDPPAPQAAETLRESRPHAESLVERPEQDGAAETALQAEPEASIELADPQAATAMDLYRRAQALMQEGKKQEGYEAAQAAMQAFIAEGDDLAWMMLESVEVGDKRIDVHFNMGPKERDTSLDGIVRPLSFRVWSAGEDSKLLRTLDFENGRFDGKVLTAAIGEQHGTMHGNLGMLEPGATYEEILEKVIEIVEDM